MKKSVSFLIVFIAFFLSFTGNAFNIPKFYHGKIFMDEPHFEESWLTSFDVTVAGGTRHFRFDGYKGRLDFTELLVQIYQNFEKGLFFHTYVPFCWIKMNDLEQIDKKHPPLDHCIRKTDIYSPGIFAGWTLNYEETTYLDFIDLTLEMGALLHTPNDAINIPLFPIGYTHRAGFAASGNFALGSYEWLTTGVYGQAIVFKPATVWSSGAYIKLDHIIPKISFLLAFCGDGQNKQIESIKPWQMFSLYFSFEIDLATDQKPWMPRLKGFFSKPLAGKNILKAGLGGFNIRIDADIFL